MTKPTPSGRSGSRWWAYAGLACVVVVALLLGNALLTDSFGSNDDFTGAAWMFVLGFWFLVPVALLCWLVSAVLWLVRRGRTDR